MEGLLLGIDLGRYHSQISVYQEKKGEMINISPYPLEDEGLIPTVLGETKDEVDFTSETMLEKFLKKLLLLVRTHYPGDTIGKLVVTVEKKTDCVEAAVYGALQKLGIGKDRALLQSYEESYISYALSQKKELWQKDVGLFDFNEKGLCYKQLSFNREHTPMALYVLKKDYSEELRYEWLENRMEREKISYVFLNLAKEALHKQDVFTIYITGAGFRDSFAGKVLPELCVGRRVFMGQNLYVHGACYKALELADKGEIPPYIYMGEDIISYNVYVPVYRDASEGYAVLSEFGTTWKEAQGEVEVILDDEEEVRIVINYPLKREDKMLIMPLEGLPKRPEKMTRLHISLAFLGEDEFVIKIKDMGFGSFYKSTNRIWEKRIKL